MFVDTARVTVSAGRGGNGCLSFRREKFIPRGGPDGGDGGRGGHIVFQATNSLNTLLPFRYRPILSSKNGQHGMGKQKHGADGEDIIVPVPIGVLVRDAATGALLADIAAEGMEMTVAHGGRGGIGNARFKSSTNQAPRRTTPGKEGEKLILELELKLLADVALIGMPNAGKSTLISKISSSKPKVADYPFTTIEPNLGMVDLGEYRTCVVADIPGLISGAHQGKGLGDRFLRHVDRCSFLLHLLDVSVPPDQALSDFDTVSKELSLSSASLAQKPRVVVLTKLDIPSARDNLANVQKGLADRGFAAVPISALGGEGIPALIRTIANQLEACRHGSGAHVNLSPAGG